MLRDFLLTLATLVVLDGLWLGVIMKDYYRQSLAPIARMSDGSLAPIWAIAALVYPLLAAGLAVLVVPRAVSAREALLLGAFFGFVTYGVYDLTNHATLREWRTATTLIDMAWGTASCGMAAWVAAWIAHRS